jgi:hypothetical protein
MTSSRSALNEAQTRQQPIDQQLTRAGWGTAERRIVEEYLLSSAETEPDYLKSTVLDLDERVTIAWRLFQGGFRQNGLAKSFPWPYWA